ncbi:hypothetical protein LWP59_16070 [Amycolatopsis acidiphila]|jgi:hypothetical protein|uniref:hypothetical protein n=1 Tax=Amycolatopsis acidiphila TaxID=715473 RepID=UPI001643A1BD|nr:hypothetical protein [Amycolatopsis acidiphila]UIJ63033.1 hypothetical protein LWP59_16070 [Amycolatopsis acidiphila]GHG65755.1 hypothetical protein GCM10017788_23460 [Amycolatopsis acidiphila]
MTTFVLGHVLAEALRTGPRHEERFERAPAALLDGLAATAGGRTAETPAAPRPL